MARITRTCDGCKKLLRKADMYEILEDDNYDKLCSECFNKWLKGELK